MELYNSECFKFGSGETYENSIKLIKHPVRRCIESLQMFLRSSCHFGFYRV